MRSISVPRRTRVALVALILVALAGFAVPDGEPSSEVVADIQLDADRRLTTKLRIAGGPVLTALVDTGASPPLIVQTATADRLRLRYVPFLTRRVQGATGEGAKFRVSLATITSLGRTSGDWDVLAYVGQVPVLKHDGILGMGFMRGYTVDMDLKGSTLRLLDREHPLEVAGSSHNNCDPRKPQFTLGGACGVDMAYIDTGARRTVMNAAMARRLGIDTTTGGSPAEPMVGASGKSLPARSYAHAHAIGGIQMASVLVADFPPRGGCEAACAEMILGMDHLSGLSRIVISPSRIILKL